MSTNTERFDRNIRLFGVEGQRRIGDLQLGVVGCGGLGSFVIQEAVYLGVRDFVLVDPDVVTPSSLNRLVGAVPADVPNRTPKVDVGARVIRAVDPQASIQAVAKPLSAAAAENALRDRHLVMACLDDDLARLQLAQWLSDANLASFDLATDVSADGASYGGRVVFSEPGRRCVYCLGELDEEELTLANLSQEQRQARDASYGVDRQALDSRGASVVSLNGVVGSLAVTEMMTLVTGLRPPAITVRYLGHQSQVRVGRTEPTRPCPICARD